jgi:hypothetical protein
MKTYGQITPAIRQEQMNYTDERGGMGGGMGTLVSAAVI